MGATMTTDRSTLAKLRCDFFAAAIVFLAVLGAATIVHWVLS